MKRRVLTVSLAVLLALLGTAGVLAYVRQADARAVAGVRAVSVLVAQQEIPAGTPAGTALRDGLLASQRLPAKSVPADAIGSLTGDLGSQVMSANVQPGTLLLRPMLVTKAAAAATGALAIPKGMVAVTIPLCLPEAVAGYVQPGAQVAVFDTYVVSGHLSVQENCGSSGTSHQSQAQGEIRTRIVLTKVQVLAVGSAPASGTSGNSTTSSPGSSGSQGPSGAVLVTLAVSQADAERLILLTETGVSYLALLTPSSQTSFDTGNVPLFRP